MARQLRIGCIGTGRIAERQVAVLRELSIDGVRVIAAAGRNAERLSLFGEKYDIPNLYTDWRRLTGNPDIDAVLVCTPNSMHYENTVHALRRGKHVLLEKPMATNAEEAEEMEREAKQSGKLLMMAFQHRFNPEAQMLRRAALDGTLGDIVYVRAQALRRRGIPSWGVFGQKEQSGGGPLIDIGVHVMEMAHYIMGSPRPATARGSVYTYIGDKPCDVACKWGPWDHATYSVEDLGVGFVTFDNGASMTIETSYAAHIEDDVWNVQVMGTKGGGTTAPGKLFFDHAGIMRNETPAFLDKTDGFTRKMRHFCECVLDGVPCEAPAGDGVVLQKMLDGLYRSAEQKREIAIR